MPPRNPTPDILAPVAADGSRANTDDAALAAMFGPVAGGRQDIPVDLIDDNPWQPRQDYDGIDELAADIQRNGLLQIPAGRRIADGRVQLQYGHRRLRAVKHLGWATMPVEIQSIVEDRDMAIRAWVENHNRQDFTALDQARYFKRLQDDGWTQQQIADQLGLARPTISNAVRLLKLPEDMQTQVAEKGLSARQAEALLSLVDLPPEIKTKAEANWDDSTRPSSIVRSALAGASSDDTRKRTADLLKRHATPIHEEAWYKQDFPNARELFPAVVAVSCQQCPQAIKRDAGVFCANRECIVAKKNIRGRILLQAASQAVNIPSAEQPFYTSSDHESFSYESQRDAILTAEPRCPNLRLALLGNNQHPSNYATVEGHPKVAIVCQKPGNYCRCLAKARTSGAAPNKTKPAMLEKEIIQPAAAVLAEALAAIDPGILCLLSNKIRLDNDYSAAKAPLAVVQTIDSPAVIEKVSRIPFEQHCKDYRSPDLNREIAAALLALTGLRAPWLPPLADELSQALAALSSEIDDYQVPGDGLPTPERMAAIMAQLDQLHDTAKANVAGDDLLVLMHLYRNIWGSAIALNDRVQRSHDANPIQPV
jgi:ParB family chromosome partitioning protein